MDGFTRLPAAERQLYFEQTAVRMNVNPRIIEKDFWVCWTLQELFTLPEIGEHLTFKGGTSLSKVYRAIERFSEDIDVSVERAYLGFGEEKSPETPGVSGKERKRRVEGLKESCGQKVREEIRPQLEARFRAKLPPAEAWEVVEDADSDDGQTLLFYYPAAFVGPRDAYVRPAVKIELGARSDHYPREIREVTPYVAEQFPQGFTQPACRVQVLQAERTFWEKATLLHAYGFYPVEKALPPRLSRHYYDLSQLISRGFAARAVLEPGLLERVVEHKKVFFPSGWSNYDSAVKGTLRLLPPTTRHAEWEADYGKMGEMFFGPQPPTFAEILATVGKFEQEFNRP